MRLKKRSYVSYKTTEIEFKEIINEYIAASLIQYLYRAPILGSTIKQAIKENSSTGSST
jgi:hypothetical protein